MEKIIRRYVFVILGLILILAFFLRFCKLNEVPDGLYQDETAIGYNAFSILETGKDEYGVSYPLYFKSFGDDKLPVYIYLTAFSEKLFGVNPFAVRFFSAFFGSLTIIILYLFVYKITRNSLLSLLSSLLLCITPWHLHFSRAAFEVNIAFFFALSGSLLLLYAKEKTRYGLIFLIFSVVLFGLSLYSYNVTRLLAPLLALSVIFIYRKEFRILPLLNIIISILILCIVLFPFASTFFTSAGAESASGALVTSKDIIARNLEFRSYLLEYPLFAKLFFNNWIGVVWVYFENLGKIFDASFFFTNGSSHGNQGVGTTGVFYLFELPLFLIGVVALFKKYTNARLIVFWGVISFLVLGMSKEVPHATRGYFLLLPITFCTTLGLVYLHTILRKMNKKIYYIVILLIFCFAGYNIIHYFTSYFIRFPIMYAKDWRQQDFALVEYIAKNDYKYDRIIIDSKIDFIYTSYLFYAKYPPQKFIDSAKRLPDDSEGFSKVQSFGKIVYKEIDWIGDYKNNTLIITTPHNKPNEIPPLEAFYYPTRPVVVSLKEQVFEYPVTDIPYVLVEGKE